MAKNKDIEQLFREGLESFEVQPSKKVWRGVRYDLLRRNFWHFQPRTLNVWYAGGVVVLGIILAVAFFEAEDFSFAEASENKDIPYNEASDNEGLSYAEASENKKLSYDIANENEDKALEAKPGTKTQELNQVTVEDGKNISENKSGLKSSGIKEIENSKNEFVSEDLSVQDKATEYSGLSVMAWFKASSEGGCVPLAASFKNYSQNAVRYSWSFGDGGSSEAESPSYIFDEPGTWYVSLIAYSDISNSDSNSKGSNSDSNSKDSNGKDSNSKESNSKGSNSSGISVFTDTIRVYPKPEARFSMDVQGDPGEGLPVYFYNYSRGAESYLWDFGDGSSSGLKDPDHYFSKKSQTNIKLLAISEAGCTDSVILQDAFKEGEPVFIFPTAFSPNPDGPGTGQYSKKSLTNDVFYPHVIEQPEEYQLRIFNRNGALLFESNDIHIGWDGYYRQELVSQGVYVWKARARFSDGRRVVRMGDVTVLRE